MSLTQVLVLFLKKSYNREITFIRITVNNLCGFWVLKAEDLNNDK